MATTKTIQQLNQDLADKIMQESRRAPRAYLGKFVGIANGRVILVTDDLKELARQLQDAEPDANKTFVVEPGLDLSKVDEIWEAR
jgi:hypothetical protein